MLNTGDQKFYCANDNPMGVIISTGYFKKRNRLKNIQIDLKKERIRTKKQTFDIKKATICVLIVISFLISVTTAATDNNSDVKHKSSHHKGSHVAKKVKTELVPDPDPAITALGADPISPSLGSPMLPSGAPTSSGTKVNEGPYAGSSTTINTGKAASNTVNKGLNSGNTYNSGLRPGTKVYMGPYAGSTFNFGYLPGGTVNTGEHPGDSYINGTNGATKYNSGENPGATINKGEFAGDTFNNATISPRLAD